MFASNKVSIDGVVLDEFQSEEFINAVICHRLKAAEAACSRDDGTDDVSRSNGHVAANQASKIIRLLMGKDTDVNNWPPAPKYVIASIPPEHVIQIGDVMVPADYLPFLRLSIAASDAEPSLPARWMALGHVAGLLGMKTSDTAVE